MAKNEQGIAGASLGQALSNTNSDLPITYSQDIQGGLTTVDSEGNRLSISAQLLQEGMIVYQSDSDSYYRFTGLNAGGDPITRDADSGNFNNAGATAPAVTVAASWEQLSLTGGNAIIQNINGVPTLIGATDSEVRTLLGVSSSQTTPTLEGLSNVVSQDVRDLEILYRRDGFWFSATASAFTNGVNSSVNLFDLANVSNGTNQLQDIPNGSHLTYSVADSEWRPTSAIIADDTGQNNRLPAGLTALGELFILTEEYDSDGVTYVPGLYRRFTTIRNGPTAWTLVANATAFRVGSTLPRTAGTIGELVSLTAVDSELEPGVYRRVSNSSTIADWENVDSGSLTLNTGVTERSQNFHLHSFRAKPAGSTDIALFASSQSDAFFQHFLDSDVSAALAARPENTAVVRVSDHAVRIEERNNPSNYAIVPAGTTITRVGRLNVNVNNTAFSALSFPNNVDIRISETFATDDRHNVQVVGGQGVSVLIDSDGRTLSIEGELFTTTEDGVVRAPGDDSDNSNYYLGGDNQWYRLPSAIQSGATLPVAAGIVGDLFILTQDVVDTDSDVLYPQGLYRRTSAVAGLNSWTSVEDTTAPSLTFRTDADDVGLGRVFTNVEIEFLAGNATEPQLYFNDRNDAEAFFSAFAVTSTGMATSTVIMEYDSDMDTRRVVFSAGVTYATLPPSGTLVRLFNNNNQPYTGLTEQTSVTTTVIGQFPESARSGTFNLRSTRGTIDVDIRDSDVEGIIDFNIEPNTSVISWDVSYDYDQDTVVAHAGTIYRALHPIVANPTNRPPNLDLTNWVNVTSALHNVDHSFFATDTRLTFDPAVNISAAQADTLTVVSTQDSSSLVSSGFPFQLVDNAGSTNMADTLRQLLNNNLAFTNGNLYGLRVCLLYTSPSPRD